LQNGQLVVFTPFAQLYHYEGGTRGQTDISNEEVQARILFRQKHLNFIEAGDPYYNPNLSLDTPYQLKLQD